MSSGVLLKEWNPSTRPFALAQVSCHIKKKQEKSGFIKSHPFSWDGLA